VILLKKKEAKLTIEEQEADLKTERARKGGKTRVKWFAIKAQTNWSGRPIEYRG
jgi:hypothetical protein